MTKIFIHGKLGRLFGEYHELNIQKKLDVVAAINANRRGFKQKILSQFKKGIDYDLIDPNNPDQKWATVEEFLNESAPEELHIVPSISGSAGLIAFTAAFFTAVGAAVSAFGAFLAGGGFLANLAIGVILNGIQMLLFPMPKGPAAQQVQSKLDQSSYLFSSLDNQSVQGFAIPLLYGELRVGSNVISVNVFNEDMDQS
jgi:predicted phage tail protein